ncbi:MULTISPECIES: hypothetical protein [Lysobacter]|nr:MULTISPECIES: hypothetical protein [Lysobacter]ALN91050.1 hypothetical protein LG3211_2081 [Lysobacter gummosus]
MASNISRSVPAAAEPPLGGDHAVLLSLAQYVRPLAVDRPTPKS